MTPAESWTLVLCVVLPAATMAGLATWLIWSFADRTKRRIERKDKL